MSHVWLQRSADDLNWLGQLKTVLDLGYLTDHHPWVICHDLEKLGSRATLLKEAFPPTTLHTSAVKANPLPSILRLLVGQGMGLEVASLGEMELARQVDCPPENIVFDSPAKTTAELRLASELGVTVNSNSELELTRLGQMSESGRVGLRCNPIVADTGRASATMVATKGSKFGVPMDEAAGLLERFDFVSGLHVHIGSQVATKDDLVKGARRMVELAERFPRISWLDIGGGLPTRYRESDPGLSPDDYLEELRRAVPEIDQYSLVTEIGRALHANCGWAASKVEYVADGRAVVHFGADFCLRECYQTDDWWHDFSVLTPQGELKEAEILPYDIYGPLCFSGDRMAQDRLLPRLESGDILVMHDVGAYTFSMWSRYCSRLIPEILGFENGDVQVLRRRETAGDVVKFWAGIV